MLVRISGTLCTSSLTVLQVVIIEIHPWVYIMQNTIFVGGGGMAAGGKMINEDLKGKMKKGKEKAENLHRQRGKRP